MEEDFAGFVSPERRTAAVVRRLIVVRHAESVANTEGFYQGQTYDTDLSPLGKKQAEALAKKTQVLGIKKIISSPLKRAYQTALKISKLINLPIDINDLVTETNHGVWEGKRKDWIRVNFPDEYASWQTTPSQVVFPKGEAFIETFQRIESFLNNLPPEDEDMMVVTHDNIVRILVTLANGWTLDQIWEHDIEPAALNFFEFNSVDGKKKLKLLKLNDNGHLEGLHANLAKHAL